MCGCIKKWCVYSHKFSITFVESKNQSFCKFINGKDILSKISFFSSNLCLMLHKNISNDLLKTKTSEITDYL